MSQPAHRAMGRAQAESDCLGKGNKTLLGPEGEFQCNGHIVWAKRFLSHILLPCNAFRVSRNEKTITQDTNDQEVDAY